MDLGTMRGWGPVKAPHPSTDDAHAALFSHASYAV